ncbi:putative transcriptional regulator [Metallosphaera yellowstonensis MK1]|uniref:Putative transcriptional regulator n=1 Tax=Metallosphaera yellowstonensis MK1 TaxID=671065 RepID=H2C704_9CREN|nr:helix-turn-helix domain-containing protein [Metallosphaera yellowstonensis]EHP69581.1 putative transcriptional regulator [Metallosphaera yellowstonensis MK1]
MSQDILDELLARVSKFASVLGISRAELKVYSALLLNGQSNARKLSDELNISYTKIYSILNKLEERGWIRKLGKKPVVYEAVSLRDLWSNIKKMLEFKVDQFEKEFIEPLSSLMGSTAAYTVMMIPQHDLKRTIVNLLGEPSKKYLVAISFKELMDQELIQLIKAKSYVAEVKLIAQRDIRVEEGGIEQRHLDNMFGSGIVTSSSVLLIIKSNDRLTGIISNHRYLVDIAVVYFDHLWEQASKP